MEPDPDQLAQSGYGLLQAGDFAGAADALGRAGHGYQRRGRAVDAAAVLVAAARLRAMSGDLDDAARLLDVAAPLADEAGRAADVLRARAELADQRADEAARLLAWQACAASADPALALDAQFRLGQLARERGDLVALTDAIEAALARVTASGDQAQTADLHVELATVLTQRGELDRARAELVTAAALAAADDWNLQARITGQHGVIAFTEGELEPALRHAQAARSAAVQASNVPTYLAAASLLTMVHERRGELVDALDAIMRAQASLGDLLGPEGAALVAPALTMFRERIGEPAYADVHATWRTRRTAERAQPGGS